MITSIYKNSKILSYDYDVIYPFVLLEEDVYDYEPDKPTRLYVAYTYEGRYIGDKGCAEYLISKGITEQLQPHNTGQTCSIGFNRKEQRWYGWSHRAIYSFGIGSKVKIGDCAYSPRDIDDLNKSMLMFWNVNDGIWRTCESPTITCTTRLISIESNYIDEDNRKGTSIKTETIFKGADRDYSSSRFHEYPEVWGHGEWMALTLDDAKQMAIDYAEGIN
jgi:hypothetical protein